MSCPSFKTPKKIKIIVEKVPHNNGEPCDCHTEGQVFEVDFERCPANFCASAFHTLWPHLRTLEMGGRHPWDEKPGETRVCCPDPHRPVVFKIVAE